MQAFGGRSTFRAFILAAAGSALAISTGCSTQEPGLELSETSTNEYFSEVEYGVKASPRVSASASDLRRGGGRYQVGKPYKIKGKWYRPQEDPDYKKVGAASWYGSAFHGRLTANGEVYDMTRLTAAHPTMPLPSYARVTNLDNGSSVIVRVNDRGPFAHNRIIDLSKQAADLLDYRDSGVAKVEVAYVGPAPLHGQDDQYLVASYQPNGVTPSSSDGLPPGVMIAMNGSTPSAPVGAASAAFASQPGIERGAGDVDLPDIGPLVPNRPAYEGLTQVASLSYAPEPKTGSAEAFRKVLEGAGEAAATDVGYIMAGSWASHTEAETIAQTLSRYGRPGMQASELDGETLYTVRLFPDGRYAPDVMLRAAWMAGATDALPVRE